jgi:hypothetical protein
MAHLEYVVALLHAWLCIAIQNTESTREKREGYAMVAYFRAA